MSRIEAGRAVLRILELEKVPFVAGIPGGSMFEIVAGLADTPAVRPILTRHERVAVDIADGYGRVSGRAAVSASVKGPGTINALSGISHAYADSVPLLHLAGQVDQRLLGRQAFQENSLLDMSRDITKWNARVSSIDRMPEIFTRAFTHLMSGRPRPILIELPSDVMGGSIDEVDFRYQPVGVDRRLRTRGAPEFIEEAAELLITAQRPLLYVGAGVLLADACAELRELAELMHIPVMTTLNGKSAFPEDHALSLGIGGLPQSIYSTRVAALFSRTADVVLSVGNSFKREATRGEPRSAATKLIHVDVDPFEIHKEQRADVAILGDAALILSDIATSIRDRVSASEFDTRRTVYEEIASRRDETFRAWLPVLTSDQVPINPYRVVWDLMNVTDPARTIVLHDAGNTRGYVAHIYTATVPRGFIGMGGQSNLGYSLGGAMGSKLAAPEKLVVNFMGDGALGFTGMDLETAVREAIPILTILLNNGSHGSWMPYADMYPDKDTVWMHFGGDYSGLARSLGAYAERVERPEHVEPALRRAIEITREGQPALVEVLTDDKVRPPYVPNPIASPEGNWVPS